MTLGSFILLSTLKSSFLDYIKMNEHNPQVQVLLLASCGWVRSGDEVQSQMVWGKQENVVIHSFSWTLHFPLFSSS